MRVSGKAWIGLVLLLSGRASAFEATPISSSRAEVRRGAAMVAEVTRRKLPYATLYRLAKGQLEKNVHEGKDNPSFRLGAHLALASWLTRLPSDLEWKAKPLATHRDVALWTFARVDLGVEPVVGEVVGAMNLSPQEHEWLLRLMEELPSPQATPAAAPAVATPQ